MKKIIQTMVLAFAVSGASNIQAAEYQIDTKGAHAAINFKIKHLGYSWLAGRFNHFSGDFSYDAAKPENSNIRVLIDTKSIDSNHAERDKHLRGDDFLNVSQYPEAKFVSRSFEVQDKEHAIVKGDFTLHGVTKLISFPVEKVGEGKDPWGGYRAGFVGTTQLKLSDYGITYNLGPASTHVELELMIEGIRL